MAEPILRLNATGPAVTRLQEALAAQGYFRATVDGRFGAKTYNAVIAFQGAHGLPLDGVVGPNTWAALGWGNGTPPPTGSRGISIHIGVNELDEQHYKTKGELKGCEADALAMRELAKARGFTTQELLTKDATSTRVLGALKAAATTLRAGDILLLTYAGHGAQVPDADGDDQDSKDETWCLYDRMLLDDELYEAWGAFSAGVRIVLLSDSCHSGTISRVFGTEMADVKAAYSSVEPRLAPALIEAGQTGDFGGVREIVTDVEAGRSVAVRGEPIATRGLEVKLVDAVLKQHDALYTDVRNRAFPAPVRATVITISGCQDNQLSQEANGRGVFTLTLERVFANGSFAGDYQALHREIVARMVPTQTPSYTVVGAANAAFEAERPFTVDSGRPLAVAVS